MNMEKRRRTPTATKTVVGRKKGGEGGGGDEVELVVWAKEEMDVRKEWWDEAAWREGEEKGEEGGSAGNRADGHCCCWRGWNGRIDARKNDSAGSPLLFSISVAPNSPL